VAAVGIQTRTLHLLKLQISVAVTHQIIQHVRCIYLAHSAPYSWSE